MDDGSLNLTYSLVAASVSGLADLHLQDALEFTIVDDPVINMFDHGILNYQKGKNLVITISVSVCVQ